MDSQKKTELAETRPPRKPRADGIESRRAILTAAARLATTRGLEGLSIGDLAQHIGMSKSGLYAHFKSKEELELATIETAAEIFENDVIHRIPESPRGLARVTVLMEAFLQHLRRRTFPGGCFSRQWQRNWPRIPAGLAIGSCNCRPHGLRSSLRP